MTGPFFYTGVHYMAAEFDDLPGNIARTFTTDLGPGESVRVGDIVITRRGGKVVVTAPPDVPIVKAPAKPIDYGDGLSDNDAGTH